MLEPQVELLQERGIYAPDDAPAMPAMDPLPIDLPPDVVTERA